MEPIDDWVTRPAREPPEYWPRKHTERADKPPRGYHYDPYTRDWRRNLTEAQVQSMWPYAKPKKEAPKVEPVDDWMEDALRQIGPKEDPTVLTEAPPRRLLEGTGGSAIERGKAVTKETAEMAAEVVAAANVMAAAKAGDNVHLPQHYARYKIEPIRFSIENGLDGFQFNIIKYVCRHPFKNKREDLRKAMRYLEMYIKYTYDQDPDWWR